MKENFKRNGYEILSEENKGNADVFVINSCTVTAMSDRKIRQEIHVIKKNNPDAIVVLTGCFPQAFSEDAEKIEGVDIVTGSKNRGMVVNLVNEYIDNPHKLVNICEYTSKDMFEPMSNEGFEDKTRAFLKIQDGCNQFCTYCIIPKARGRIRSKSLEDIKKEVAVLSKAGHKEVVLVGINLSSYGKGMDLTLADAVEVCCNTEGIERVRLGSLEPELITDDVIMKMKKEKKLCPQFHLSLQSGCDKTLKEMHRKYNSSEYYELVEKLRNAFEDCSVTTDIMVGFPGETDADFQESLDFVKKIGFNKAHIFQYSRRSGTPAAERTDQVKDTVKKDRAKKMQEVCRASEDENLKKMIGKTYPVLFEKENCTEFHHGYAPNYAIVKIPRQNSAKSLRKSILYVKINSIENESCIGEISQAN